MDIHQTIIYNINTKILEVQIMKTYITNRYIFTYEENSLAAKDIEMIANGQEKCFGKICDTLKVNYPEKIKYYLYDSPLEVGKRYGISEPINGFAVWGENEIYAVYNENIKCIGPHEDAHLISYLINAPKSNLISEGLAMYFDEKWWDVDNEQWASYYKKINTDLSIVKMLDNNIFDSYNCEITYPIAGAFTKYLIDKFGIDKYINLYKITEEPKNNDFQKIFNYTIYDLELNFWNEIIKIDYDEKLLNNIFLCKLKKS